MLNERSFIYPQPPSSVVTGGRPLSDFTMRHILDLPTPPAEVGNRSILLHSQPPPYSYATPTPVVAYHHHGHHGASPYPIDHLDPSLHAANPAEISPYIPNWSVIQPTPLSDGSLIDDQTNNGLEHYTPFHRAIDPAAIMPMSHHTPEGSDSGAT